MAQIFKRGDSWKAKVYFKDIHGKRTSRSQEGFRTKKEAEAAARVMEDTYKNGSDVGDKNISFSDYFQKWFHIFREPGLSDTTIARYQYTINVIDEYFGDTLFRKIKTADYQEFLNWFGNGNGKDAKPHAKATADKINTHIRAAVRNAVNDSVISRDFTQNTHVVYDSSRTREIKWLSYDDAAKLYNYTLNHLEGIDVVPYMVLTALLTGMRQQEIAGLTWDDIDSKGGFIKITKTWNWTKRDFGPTKNPASVRTISIDRNLVNILTKLQYEQKRYLKVNDKTNPHSLVFLSRYNRVPSSKALNDRLHELMKDADINIYLRFHGLRHTHASILLYQKMSIAYISHRLGHQDIATTTKTYLHIIKELEQEETVRTREIFTDLGKKADWSDFKVKAE
ncbi:integrase [Levilactobacillus senmaizukei DSM 21775 = NBRC 103853]|uniref:Integrase n=2 Tax=root TaxID=1 RepID=D6PSS4_9CAUD|nr:tyrosine-type recombinase/integrase [Levilactobacillus senmaizukei]YP_009168540.1 integrase [Lactobacillus phage LBR48]ADF83415.1 putative integrase [Lactobacillus phage LBR48]KRN00964.1 integrase [Levilactobacillus senmaizukei DSM 21775 = NBRC 103853]